MSSWALFLKLFFVRVYNYQKEMSADRITPCHGLASLVPNPLQLLYYTYLTFELLNVSLDSKVTE